MYERRFVSFVAALFLPVIIAHAAPVSGECVNTAGEPVEYVSIGIQGTGTGTISDRHGAFSLRVPDSLMNRSLTFTHLSYDSLSLPLAGFSGERSARRRVVLRPHAFEIGEITVMPRKMKIVNLNSRGVHFLGAAFRMIRPSPDDYLNNRYDSIVGNQNMDMHLGARIELGGKKAWIREVDLVVLKNTFDTCVVRIVAYEMRGSTLVPLMQKPYYIHLPKIAKKQDIVCQIADEHIRASGTLHIGIEVVEASQKGTFALPAYRDGAASIIRDPVTGLLMNTSWGCGVRIRGSYLDEAKKTKP